MESKDSAIRLALERFKLAAEAEAEFRRDALQDLKFSTGDQWDKDIRSAREQSGRPCLTMDQLQQSVRLVCNTYRQQRPSININPIGDGADVDTAEIIQGIFRHIDVNSDAEIAYDGAHEQVVRTGFGSWRLRSDYYDDNSDDQEVIIEPIENQFTVYWQPNVPQSKARWCFLVCDYPIPDYKADNPDSEMSRMSATEYSSVGDSFPTWATESYIRVAEYFEVQDVKGDGKRPGKQVVWSKINAIEYLEKPQGVPGTSIPIFTAYGDNINIDGKKYVAGLIRNAKDAQRQYNFMNSAATEQIALAPVAPWIIAEGQIEGHEKIWSESNRNPRILTYKQTDVGGHIAPPPSRVSVEPPIQATTLMIRQASMDLKAATGIYDPSLGQRKGDESGKAIEKLQSQGDVATLNYSDNIARAMRREGRVRLEWIKKIYDVPRIQRIIKPDGTVNQVVIHNGQDQAQAAQQLLDDQKKITKIYDIGTGRYDIAISIGPSYQSKRQEAVVTQTALVQSFPEIMPVAGDLIVRNMDIPGANEIADRLKKMLPPNLQDDDETDPAVQVQKLQGQLQQMAQQHDLLTQELNKATQIIQTKQVETDGKSQIAQMQEMSKQAIVKMQEATKLAVAQINASKDINQSFAELESEQYGLIHQSAHDRAMGDQQHAQAKDLASQQAQQRASQSSQDHGQAKDLEGQKHEQTLEQQDQAGDQAENQAMLAGQIAKETAKAKPNGRAVA